MAENRETLVVLAEEIASVFVPIKDALESPGAFAAFMAEMGWDILSIPAPIQNMGSKVQSIIDTLDADNLDSSNVAGLMAKITALVGDINNLSSIGSVPATVDLNAFKNEFPTQLVQFLLVEYLEGSQAKTGAVLRAVGVVRSTFKAADPGKKRLPYYKKEIAFQDLSNFFTDPTAVFTNAYKWGANDFKGDDFWQNFYKLGSAFGFNIRQDALHPAIKAVLTAGALDPSSVKPLQLKLIILEDNSSAFKYSTGVSLYLLPPTSSKKPGIVFLPFASASVKEDIAITDELTFLINANADLSTGVGLMIRPDEIKIATNLIGGTTPPPSSLKLKLGLQYATPGKPTVLLGQADGSRLEIGSAAIKVGAAVASNGEHEILAELELKEGKLVVKAGEGDSFLRIILGENGIEGNFDLLLGWSSKEGIYFQGSGGLEIALPTHISLGPIEIQGITIGVKPEAGKIPISLGVDVQGNLGPLTAMVQGIGFKAVFSFPDDNNGNLGPVNFSPEFKWPTGVGLSIDGGGFVGGGFLMLDVDKGEYAGGMELEFQSTLALKAIGILNTKMPDGSEGFSLLIIITAEFVPIQLGFGFTLIGVGGLLGINRTMELEPLRLGVYDGSVNSILFPTDIVANASRIISDIKRIFPPREGQFVFGPMAKLGWGTPTLVSVELGLIIVVPNPVLLAILGVMRMNLPTEQVAIVYIQINFVATIDFEKKQFTLDASLFNSRILTFALTGDMAIRIYWGDNANFLFTVGGFHPAYTPPPMGLPSLRRLAIIIFSGNPNLQAESYIAITSNTFQFGCKLSLSATAGPASLKGYLSFDALIQFSPFMFIVEIGAMLAVRIFGEDMLSISLRFVLEGPSPWHAFGEGKISISFFFFDVNITVHFDVTFGEDRRETLPPLEVFDPLLEALRKSGNWRASLPANTNLLISLREIPAEEMADKLILHPFGILEVTQKVAPLDMDINKFGANAPLEEHRYFNIRSLLIGAELFDAAKLDVIREQFAPAQFREMKDAEKLSSQSFAPMAAGVRIKGSEKLKSSYVTALEVVYEVIYIPEKRPKGLFRFNDDLFNILIRGNATAKSAMAYEPKKPSVKDAPHVKVNQEQFVIANADTMDLYSDDLVFATEAEANVAKANLVAKDAKLASVLQVAAAYQMN